MAVPAESVSRQRSFANREMKGKKMRFWQRVFSTGHGWDLAGTTLSILCVIHCLVTPLVITMLPSLGLDFLAQAGFHRGLALPAIAVGLITFLPGFLRHRRIFVPLLGGAGMALLCYAAFSTCDACCRPSLRSSLG